MDTETALTIVLELAEQNALTAKEADTPELCAEVARQETACEMTAHFIGLTDFEALGLIDWGEHEDHLRQLEKFSPPEEGE